MHGWERDKKWSDAYMGHVKEILGRLLICEAPVEEDQERNTDLVVLRMDNVRVGVRIRRQGYLAKYPHDITLRMGRPSGAKTELTKIVEGWGTFFFYGHAGAGDRLEAWTVIDLAELRVHMWRHMYTHQGALPGAVRQNADGSSNFLALDVRHLPAGVVREHTVLKAAA